MANIDIANPGTNEPALSEAITRLVKAAVTGVSPAAVDGAVDSSTPTVSGYAPPYALVTIYVNGTAEASVTAASDGAWSYQLSEKTNGSYAVTVRAVPGSAAYALEIDAGAEPLRDSAGDLVLLDINPTLGIYYAGGTTYASETALMTGIGGVANGSAWDIGPYRDPSAANMLPAASAWATTSGTVTESSGEFTFTPASGAATPAAYCTYVSPDGVVDGKAVEFVGTLRRGTSANSLSAGLSSQGNTSAGNLSASVSTTTETAFALCGSSGTSEANVRAYIRSTSSSADGGTFIFKPTSVKEVKPFNGWLTTGWAALFEFTTPSSYATAKVIAQADDNSTRGKVRLVYDTDGHLRLIVTQNNSAQVSLDLGAYAVSTAGKVAFSVGQSAFYATLNGGKYVLQTSSGVMPGSAVLRFGRSNAGEAWDGTLSRKAIVASQQPTSWLQHVASQGQTNRIATNGDSYMAGAGGVILNDLLRTGTGRTVVNIGAGGSTMAEALTRLQAAPYLRDYTWVIWDGSANSYGSVSAYLATISDIVTSIGHSRIIFIPPINVGPSDSSTPTSYTNDLLSIYAGIQSLLGANRTFDPVADVFATMGDGSANDTQDLAAHVVPRSLLLDQTAGQVHLGATAMAAVEAKIAAMLTSLAI
ncbi:hypothetical protein MWN34_05350 [Ancylobacter sp. 6x-1]|uniref:SGNH/GDSL hydrolase family protein n=1 Tax=Ancylobacter crimeensis TaxID=2579147 RepID=A0ABT0D8Q6_9HYPH|nr:SGNH/GDSL hydrolase family protein [Ancylobacter crimeensis]MCK0196336.1 hypothetical protein [Ancylobacter crimeensis]